MDFEIFLATAPGLENALYEEVRSKGFKQAKATKGGVTIQGGWPEVWRGLFHLKSCILRSWLNALEPFSGMIYLIRNISSVLRLVVQNQKSTIQVRRLNV